VIVVGFALGWVGYVAFTWGYSLVKGYDLSFSEIASPTNYYKGKWPPPLAPNTVIIPNGQAASATTGKKTAASTATPFNTSGKQAQQLGKKIGPGSIQTLP
jgi:hypothetical protein